MTIRKILLYITPYQKRFIDAEVLINYKYTIAERNFVEAAFHYAEKDDVINMFGIMAL